MRIRRLALITLLIMVLILLPGCDAFYFRVIDGRTETLADVVNNDRPVNAEKKETPVNKNKSVDSGNTVKDAADTGDYVFQGALNYDRDALTAPLPVAGFYKTAVAATGLYMSANTTGIEDSFNTRLDFILDKGLNSVVIDVKDDFGNVTFKNKIGFADEMGISVNYISNLDKVLQTLRDKGIYTIARVVVFRDKVIADVRPDFVTVLNDGELYWERDSKGTPQFCWLNPYNKDVWAYVVDIAEEAAKLGFNEIQFDYIRFPTDANVKNADYTTGNVDNLSYMEIIAEFGRYAMDRLSPYGVTVSADVFGTIIISNIDSALIGQDFLELAQIFDVLCPMVYPSHFANDTLGVAVPDLDPYGILNKTFALMNEKLAGLEGAKTAVIRPWLQDFTATWLKQYKSYGGAEITAQIKACADNGISEWLMWDPSNKYNGASKGL